MATFTALATLVIGLLMGFAIASRIPQEQRERPAESENHATPVPDTPNHVAPDSNSVPEADPLLDELKVVLLGLLHTLNTAIADMQEDSRDYAEKLDVHRNALKETLTVNDLKRLGAELVHQVETMYAANAHYREKVQEADSLVKQQQDDIEKLQLKSGTDFLTNLRNRSAYDDRMKEMINIARRYGNVFSLLVMDIDDFKDVNDTHGHTAGDAVLKDLSHLLLESSRASDFLARYGGEEFVYILPELKSDQALIAAEKLRNRIENNTFSYRGEQIPITISGGISTVKPGEDTGTELFDRADKALYKAKGNGKNRIETDGSQPS